MPANFVKTIAERGQGPFRSGMAVILLLVLFLAGCTSPPGETSTVDQTPTLRIHFIDVGQGDSILIQTPEGRTMLIDGGEANSMALRYLQARGVSRLDVVVATHPHSDHIGGLMQILKAIPTARVVTNGQPTTTGTYEDFLDAVDAAGAEYLEVSIHDSITLGDLVFDVLSPFPALSGDMNENSVVLYLKYGQVGFLFTGDAGVETEGSLLRLSSRQVPEAQVLKVGHHGSRTASSEEFLAAVKPEVAIYSAGTGNTYGHPHPETLAALDAVGAIIYGTDIDGSIVVTTDGKTYKVAPARQERQVLT